MSRTVHHKETLARVALELFSARGFSGASVRDIARTAGVAEGTMYRYFANKEELVSTLYHTTTTTIDTLLTELVSEEGSVESYVPTLIVRLLGLYEQDAATFFFALDPAGDMLPILRDHGELPAAKILFCLEKTLLSRASTDRPALLIATSVLGMVLYTFKQHHAGILRGAIGTYVDGLVQASLRIIRE